MRICALDRGRGPSVLDRGWLPAGGPLASVSASQRSMAHPEGWNSHLLIRRSGQGPARVRRGPPLAALVLAGPD